MATADMYKNYLMDLCDLLREEALAAKRERDTDRSDLALGRLLAYQSVLSLMQSQAGAFGIALKEIKLDGIVPDKDLV